jgi:hypothetical protein
MLLKAAFDEEAAFRLSALCIPKRIWRIIG